MVGANPHGAVKLDVRNLMKKVLKTLFVSLFALSAAALLGGCASDRAVVQQANEVDQTLEKAVIHDPQIESYFQRLGAR